MARNTTKKEQREQVADRMLQDKENPQTTKMKNDTEKPTEQPLEQQPKSVDNVAKELSQQDLINALNIPVENDGKDREQVDESKIVDEPQFDETNFNYDDDDESSLDDDGDDLNFDEDMGSSLDNEMFEDSDLMAEIGVELIDLLIVNGCQMLAKDFGNEDKYSVSDRKKSKLKKPLAQLLRKKGTKIAPEYIFITMVLVMYAPKVIEAVQTRKVNKEKAKAKPEPQPMELSTNPRHPRPAFAPPIQIQPPTQPIIPVEEIEEKPKKKSKGGRPKGSKDTKQRKTDGYKKAKTTAKK